MKRLNFIRAVLFALCAAPIACLHALEVKGTGSVDSGRSVSKSERREAEVNAVQNAIKKWVSDEHADQYENYEFVQNDINLNIDKFLLAPPTVIDSSEENGRFTVVVRVDIDATLLEKSFLKKSDVATAGEKNRLAFVFVAREYAGSKSKSGKSDVMRKSERREVGQEKTESQAAQTKAEERGVSRASEEVKYKDEVFWRVSTSNEIDNAMGTIFRRAKFKLASIAMMEDLSGRAFNVSDFMTDYAGGDDLKTQTLSKAMTGLAKIPDRPVQYLAIGTLDIDEALVDQKTGNVRIAVSVTGQALDVLEYGEAVAKVGPIVYFGEGSTPLVARNNALKLAAEECAKQMVAQMSSGNDR